MNKNSRSNRKTVAKAKRELTFEILKTMPGGSLGVRKQTIGYGEQSRKSEDNHPKVAANGCKNPNGPTITEQAQIFYGPWLNIV